MTAALTWTDERVEQLKKMWGEGLSASQIARALGDVTRNAVIGKVHRLGLSGRAPSPRVERPRTVAPRPAPRLVQPAPAIPDEPLRFDDGSFATVMTVTREMCKWPIGDPAQNDFHFCGRGVKDGSPYCEGHARVAYQPQSSKRERDREREHARLRLVS